MLVWDEEIGTFRGNMSKNTRMHDVPDALGHSEEHLTCSDPSLLPLPSVFTTGSCYVARADLELLILLPLQVLGS